MLHTTQGIVLGHIKYRETSIIAKIFTKAFGLQAYIIQGVRTKKPKHNIALFQPLMLLDMVVRHKKQIGIQCVTEVRCSAPNSNILTNINKATMVIFLAEFLTKVIREEGEHNEPLFHFLWQEVMSLNQQTTDYDFFYLTFMLQLGHYLGFGVSTLQDIYKQLRRSGQHWEIDQETLEDLNTLLLKQEHRHMSMDKVLKRNVTEAIIKFYQLHIDSLDTLKSLKVLQEIS